jgi:hypothetical protein
MTARSEAGQAARLYETTEVLSLQRHGELGLAAERNYGFARGIISVPASLTEIVLAQRFYPVVFAGADTLLPVIVLGLSEGSGNLFVEPEGRWTTHCYVPAFLRRYPFIAVPKVGGKELMLAADLSSELIVKNGPRPFFADGKPSEEAKRTFDFCARLHADFEAARDFAGALAEAGLLREQRAEINFGGIGRLELTNFRMVDEPKFDALPDETFLDWRRRGWLASVHAHLMSLASWGDLARRAGTPPDPD